MENLPTKVTIVEVGPRDGLQNETLFVQTQTKIEFINLLSKTGLEVIESGSFVSSKAIPQLADTEQVLKGIEKSPNIAYPVLVPNVKGLESALKVDAKHIALFASASEAFSQKNINCSIGQSLQRFKAVVEIAKTHQLHIRAYISCIFACPYQGEIKPQQVAKLCQQLVELGVDEISLGDTIGVGTPNKCKNLIEQVSKYLALDKISMHFHNTYGQAIANIYASLQSGITIFDSAVAGLGGCPYAKGATGNVATEDVLYLMQGLNIQTNVDLVKLAYAGKFICDKLGKLNNSFVGNAILR